VTAAWPTFHEAGSVRFAASNRRSGRSTGTVTFEHEVNAKGERMIWLERVWLDKVAVLRGPGESLSDSIMRLAAVGASLNGS
jgi:hypothetical protein